jgi:dTDP-4-amino-4,6-dideoxygalactose transaminase
MISFFTPHMQPIANNPYLKDIDANKWYSNFGPLVKEFEKRLSHHFRIGGDGVVTANNGTIALMGMISCFELKEGASVLMPSWTFAAAPLAVKTLGYNVVYADIDPIEWALTPEIAYGMCTQRPIDLVMPVMPFGAPIDIEGWEEFQRETGIPVMIDAAAGFANVKPSTIPQMISLHPTKIFSSCEGGLLVSLDEAYNQRFRRWCNFGFDVSRQSQFLGLNAKMSELNAAVGLQNLEEFDNVKNYYYGVAESYLNLFKEIPYVSLQKGFGTEWISTSLMMQTYIDDGDKIMAELGDLNIESRRWWGAPCHLHPALKQDIYLPMTEIIHSKTFSVPFHLHLTYEDVLFVIHQLERMMCQKAIAMMDMEDSLPMDESALSYNPF